METCILKYIYFNTSTRSIISEVHSCRQEAVGKWPAEECLKGVNDIVEGLKAEVIGWVSDDYYFLINLNIINIFFLI